MNGIRNPRRWTGHACLAVIFVSTSAFAAGLPGIQPFRGPESIYRHYLHDHFATAVRPNPWTAATRAPHLAPLNLAGLKVSADTATGQYRQLEPAVGRFDNGNYAALWRDDQNGTDVLMKRRFDGNLGAMGAQSPLFGDGILRLPTGITAASDGRTMLAGWLDNVTGNFTGAFIDSQAQVTSTISINSSLSPELIGAPAIGSMIPRGHIAVWEEFQSGGWHIFSQRFDSLGVLVGTNINVDGGSNSPLRFAPAVAADTAGGFMVAWTQGDNTRSDIYARAFNAAGSAVGAAFALTSPVSTESYIAPTVTYVAASDQYWIGFIKADPANDSTTLLLQRTDRNGANVGTTTALDAERYPWQPQAVTTDTSIVFITTRYDNLSEVRALALDSAVGIIDSSEIVHDLAFNTRSAATATADADTVLVVWQDRRSGQEDIRGRLRTDVAAAGVDLKLNEEAAGGQQTHAAIIGQPAGGVRIAFGDTQRDGGDIGWVNVAEDGTLTGRTRISDDSTGSRQFEPSAASDSTGRALVTWTDERTDWPGPARHAAGRFVSTAGTPDSTSFPLAATNTATAQTEPAVAMALDGRAAVTWIDNRSGTAQTLARFFDPTGTPATGDLVANDGGLPGISISFESAPAIAIDSLNRVWAAWSLNDAVTDSFHVLVQCFRFDGTRRGNTIDISPLGTTAEAVEFSLAALGTGGFRLAWADPDSLNGGVWLRDYDSAGTPIAAPRRISDSAAVVHDPHLWIDQYGRYTIAWSQVTGTDEHIIWQRFHPNDAPVDTLERLSPDSSASRRRLPVIAASQTYLYAAWHDNATAGRGFDIRVSSLVYAPAGVNDDRTQRPDQFALYQNYPNPFNPETVIRFFLPQPADADLDIFNLLGQRVKHIPLGALPAGVHQQRWDARNDQGMPVGSGVYFYRVTAGDYTASRKMLLLR